MNCMRRWRIHGDNIDSFPPWTHAPSPPSGDNWWSTSGGKDLTLLPCGNHVYTWCITDKHIHCYRVHWFRVALCNLMLYFKLHLEVIWSSDIALVRIPKRRDESRVLSFYVVWVWCNMDFELCWPVWIKRQYHVVNWLCCRSVSFISSYTIHPPLRIIHKPWGICNYSYI